MRTRNILTILFCVTVTLSLACNTELSLRADTLSKDRVDTGVAEVLGHIREPQIPERTIDLIEFSGHKPDEKGIHDFRPDIQRAIDELAEKGGGSLLFPHPQGRREWVKYTYIYRIKGPIRLRSNVGLVLEPSIKLFFECSPEDYLPAGRGVLLRYEGTCVYSFCALIRAFNAENISITRSEGNGADPVITGDGESWLKVSRANTARRTAAKKLPSYLAVREFNAADTPIAERRFDNPNEYILRPCVMEFFLCKNVLVDGVFIKNSPFWCVHPVFSENLTFRNILFDAQNVNNDGIDVDSCRYVLLENIFFNNHDDNIVIKSGRNREGREGSLIAGTELEGIDSGYINDGRIGGPTEHVVARNCVLKGHYGIAFGSETSGGARNIYCIDNIAPQDVRMGIFIKSSRKRGGGVEDIYIRNLRIDRVVTDAVSIIPNYDGDTESPYPPKFKNIYIENVGVRRTKNAIRIFGWPDMLTENVLLRNVNIETIDDGGVAFAYNHIRNITLENVTVAGKKFDGRYSKSDSSEPVPSQN